MRTDCPLCAGFDGPFSRFYGFHAHLSRGCAPFVEDHAVEVVGQIGEREFGLRSGQADGADEEAIAVLLMRKDVLTLARIADFAALARAMLSGIGVPLGLRRWMRLLSMLAFSNASFLALR